MSRYNVASLCEENAIFGSLKEDQAKGDWGRGICDGETMVGLVVGKSPRDEVESDEVKVEGQECLTRLPASGKEGQVVEQMWIIADHAVFDFLPGECRDYWLKI